MWKANRTKLEIGSPEFIGLRVGFSIYSGWVSAAFIINVASYLKMEYGMMEDESYWACVILYVALAIYVLVSFIEKNPVFGCVYVWVLLAIMGKQTDSPDI